MRDVKDYHSDILHIIQDMRSRGFSDNRIIQTFQLVLEDTQGMYAIPKKDPELISTVTVKIFKNLDDVEINGGDKNTSIRAAAALIFGHALRAKQPTSFSANLALAEVDALERRSLGIEVID